MSIHKRLFKRNQKLKNSTLRILLAVLLIGLISLISLTVIRYSLIGPSALAELSSSSEQVGQSLEAKPQFEVHVTYTYVGPRKDHFSEPNPLQDQSSIATLYARSLYPSIVCLNFTHISSADAESCDAKMEVYLVQIISDTGRIENYTYAEGTNYNPAFSDLNALSSHINDFADARDTNGLRGGFIPNWAPKESSLWDRVGSYGSYTSAPSGLGLWSAGEPNMITVCVRRIGWITLNGNSASTTLDANSEIVALVKLEKFGAGFLYNTIVPLRELSQIDLYNPPIPLS